MSTAAASPLSQSVLNKAYPEYEYKQPPVNEDWVAEIYQPPPLIKALTGHVRYYLGPRAEYDEHQRRFAGPSADVEEQYAKASWIEKIRYVCFGGTGNVLKERPFPWKDQYQRSGFCPEFYTDHEWKFPRRTFLNKYVPPPKVCISFLLLRNLLPQQNISKKYQYCTHLNRTVCTRTRTT